ncbi:MAG: thermonuclease family protein [Candidatus Pacebacteria bacterium]|nr:thermonuclease family protein [Candidatus Paceibacterota bacterium]
MNKNYIVIIAVSLFVVGLICCLGVLLDNPIIDKEKLHSSRDDALFGVVRVIDGDTVIIKIDGKNETVRLIGINTPEVVDPRRPVECFGIEASNRAKEILSGKRVRLEVDDLVGERDKYGRLLKYIFLEDGINFNKMMINEGYAYEYTFDLPYKYQSEFKQAEKEAREAKRGLWADGVCEN